MAKKGMAAAGVAFALALAAVLLFIEASVSGQDRPPTGPRAAAPEVPPESRFFDADGDKVYDNLEHLMAQVAPGTPLDVIVLFRLPLDEVDFPGLRGLLGGADPLPLRARFPTVNGIATTLAPGQIRLLAAQEVVIQIENDDIAEPHLDTATYWFGVQRGRLDFSAVTGAQRTIAILDTGIDPNHQDLNGKIVAWVDFTDKKGGNTICSTPCDLEGHGTHVSSIAGGTHESLAANNIILDFTFSPTPLTVNAGATVTWRNLDSPGHTTTDTVNGDTGETRGQIWDSDRLETGESFSFTFNQTGTFTYMCTIHTSMRGTVEVVDTAGPDQFRGVAPGADLAGVRVLRQDGTGTRTFINNGLQWVIDNRATFNIQVLNMSLGFGGSSDGQSSTERLVNEAVAAGVVAALSAGNAGPNRSTIGDPSAAAHAISVAAMADIEQPGIETRSDIPAHGDYLVAFSSRGPTADGRIKPDIAAPGVQVTAAEAGTTSGYVLKSGTSMSSPFIAGMAALLLHAGLSPPGGTCTVNGTQTCTITDPVKDTLLSTARCWGSVACPNIDYGAGRLDTYAALLSALPAIGDNVRISEHTLIRDSLTGSSDVNSHVFNVQTLFFPIAIAMIQDEGGASFPFCLDPDFVIELYGPGGNLVASDTACRRQNTVTHVPLVTGNYTLKVFPFDGSGVGDYSVDISAGTALLPAPDIALTSDGLTDFGVVLLSVITDSIGDPEVVQITLGPGDLTIQTTLFTAADGNTWALGTTNGTDRAVWEFSPDGITWTVFTASGLAFDLAQGLKDGGEQSLLFRLTMPTDSGSSVQHSATVTVTGVAPD